MPKFIRIVRKIKRRSRIFLIPTRSKIRSFEKINNRKNSSPEEKIKLHLWKSTFVIENLTLIFNNLIIEIITNNSACELHVRTFSCLTLIEKVFDQQDESFSNLFMISINLNFDIVSKFRFRVNCYELNVAKEGKFIVKFSSKIPSKKVSLANI